MKAPPTIAERLRRAYEAAYAEATAQRRSCTERNERGLASAMRRMIELTGEERWARERTAATLWPRHAYSIGDPHRHEMYSVPPYGEQGDEGIAPPPWAWELFEGDVSYWTAAWERVIGWPAHWAQERGG